MNWDKLSTSDSDVSRELQDELCRLREENARFKSLLAAHGISWDKTASKGLLVEISEAQVSETPPQQYPPIEKELTKTDKIALFRRLFRGRTDVYPVRWESVKGTAGYSPACGNEWKPGVCLKPRIKCGDCEHRLLLPVTDQVIRNHLTGKHTVGVYPLLSDDTCLFLAVDFDKAEWQENVKAFMQSCRELDIPAALEISRSGKGAHAWIFFTETISAREARRLGAALISHTCNRTRQLALTSYDRLIPNQDTLPKGGFGNLIALPLQNKPREKGHSVFVSEDFVPYPDQWAFLASIIPMAGIDIESAIFLTTGGENPLDVAFVTDEEESKPWKRPAPHTTRISGPLPESLELVVANQIFIAKTGLPQPLSNRLIRLAAFQNPEFYKAQAMRKVSTLILVHRTELLRQWQERLTTFLDLSMGALGVIGGGKKKPSGQIDIAVMQSLSRRDDLADMLDGYGQIIVDECHHLSAFSFEAILKQAKAKYVVGLTATPIRRDGHHPIIFMQCGPIRHSAKRPESAPTELEVWPQKMSTPVIPFNAGIQDIFRILVNDANRNQCISRDILSAYHEGRKILVLTERTEHLDLLREVIGEGIEHCFLLHGRLSKKQRSTVFSALFELDASAPRVLLATGRLIGEGFDHPPLDTLVLAMPISWKGTLQQYAGRLHREHDDKKNVRIYDYVEHDHPQLARMWEKRRRGYRAMGYVIRENRKLE